MIRSIGIDDLRIGMYVILPTSWFGHSFLTNRFSVQTQVQIRQIRECGFKELQIDTDKGMNLEELVKTETIGHGDNKINPPSEWNPEALVPDALKEAVRDSSMPSQKRAKIVYESSVQIMEKLLEDPKTENIRAAKDGITDVVDVILADDSTARQLLRVTSHDFYTYTHSVNVGVLSIMLCKSLFKGMNGHDMHELGAGFFLHDLGKTRVDTAIINKPGRLTEDEMKKMRAHPYQSYKILKEADLLSEECRIIALQHHEREDGTGYPQRLRGDEIHIYGRIGCIADVYDALTAERSYKRSLSPFEALTLMKEQMINHFQKDVFSRFVLLFTG